MDKLLEYSQHPEWFEGVKKEFIDWAEQVPANLPNYAGRDFDGARMLLSPSPGHFTVPSQFPIHKAVNMALIAPSEGWREKGRITCAYTKAKYCSRPHGGHFFADFMAEVFKRAVTPAHAHTMYEVVLSYLYLGAR